MMERMQGVYFPGQVGRFRPEQIAQQSTWTVVPENQRVQMAMHTKHMIPAGSTTITYVNPLDTSEENYYDKPGSWGSVHRAGIWR